MVIGKLLLGSYHSTGTYTLHIQINQSFYNFALPRTHSLNAKEQKQFTWFYKLLHKACARYTFLFLVLMKITVAGSEERNMWHYSNANSNTNNITISKIQKIGVGNDSYRRWGISGNVWQREIVSIFRKLSASRIRQSYKYLCVLLIYMLYLSNTDIKLIEH